jgi:protein SCO1/2
MTERRRQQSSGVPRGGVFIALLVVVTAVSAIAIYAMVTTRFQTSADVTGVPTVTIGGPFKLTTKDGGTLTSDELRGEPFAIFFGYTRCPDVCPTTLTDLAALMQKLGPDADRMRFVFVSVDPIRDTPDVLKQYISVFDPRIMGLTGTEDEIATVAKEYRVFYEKVPTKDGDYTMNHTASVYLMDSRGEFTGVIDYHEDADTASAKLRRLIGAKAASL